MVRSRPRWFSAAVTELLTDDLADLDAGARSAADPARAAVVQAAIDAFRQHAFHEVDFEVVAESGTVSEDEVRAQFADFDALVLETVHTWFGDRMRPLLPLAEDAGAVVLLRAVVVSNLADPALMRMLSALVNVAATSHHPLSGYLQQEWLHFYALVQRTLIRDVELGREPDGIDCARAAEQLIALYEGLQIQAMVRPGMRLLEGFDRAVTRLRAGWAQECSATLWQI